jgi:M6 family metalloprotease-like protein
MSRPFFRKEFTFTQPDGTRINLRGSGNQHFARFETPDGYTVVRDPATHFWRLARVAADGSRLEPDPQADGRLDGRRTSLARGVRLTREAVAAQMQVGAMNQSTRRCEQRRRNWRNLKLAARNLAGPAFAPPSRATVGEFRGLCLLIDFSDAPATITQQQVDAFCNQVGYSGFGNNGSVHDYFVASSLGRCEYTNLVLPYYRAKKPKTYYTNPNVTQGVRARELILEALTHWKASIQDFSSLTSDSGGYVYAMNVYYAGPVVNDWAQGLWPHAWNLAQPVTLAPGRAAYDYQFTALGSELELGTFCHENGHMLCDYPDLYDYGDESSGVGAYCLMCAGSNIDEKNPVHICAYLKRLSGWAHSVQAIEHDRVITLSAGTNDFAMFAKSPTEYFLIENRRRFDRDAALPDEGLAIWHVDESGDNRFEQRTAAQHYELSLEQADGVFDLESRRDHYGGNGDLFDATDGRFAGDTMPDSRWWDGSHSNLEIRDTSAAGATITFRTLLGPIVGGGGGGGTGTGTGGGPVTGSSQPGTSIPDNDATGIADTIDIAQDGAIVTAKVGLDIAHTWIGDLRVTLRTPWGDEIRLHEKGQGSDGDDIVKTLDEASLPTLSSLRGRSAKGAWRLSVQDLAPADVGKLRKWSLEFQTAAASPTQFLFEEAPGAHVPDNDANGIERAAKCTATGNVSTAKVAVDIAHTWIGDLEVSLRSPAGTVVPLHQRAGRDADNLVATFTGDNTPPLAGLAGESAAGDWVLRVADREAADLGKLNSWRLELRLHPLPGP